MKNEVKLHEIKTLKRVVATFKACAERGTFSEFQTRIENRITELENDKRKPRNKCLMKNSGVTVSDIGDAFRRTDDLKNANARHYYDMMLDWSDGKGEMRKDWIATARTFARRDLADGKLKYSLAAKTGTNLNAGSRTMPDDYGEPSPTAVTREEYLKSKKSKQ